MPWGDHMRKLIAAFATVSLLVAASCTKKDAAPADPLVGTWKTDLASVDVDERPSTYLLKNGMYSCDTCEPSLSVKADGGFHAVAGRSSFDSMSVKVVDDRTVAFVRKQGSQIVGKTTMAVSPDGNRIALDFTDTSSPDAPPVTAKGAETRVAAASPGSHAVSGSWKTAMAESMSDEDLTFSLRVKDNTVHLSAPSGQSYAASLDGTAGPMQGDAPGTTVSVERVGPNILRETYRRDNQIVRITTMTIAPDGTMNGVSENKLQSSTTTYTARKVTPRPS